MSELPEPFPVGTTVPVPEIFRCPLCDDDFSVRGFTRHLTRCCRSHDLSLDDYQRQYSTRLYGPIHEFAAKWFTLAGFSIHRFGLMKYLDRYWFHIDSRKPRPSYSSNWGRKPETLPLVRYKDRRPLLRESFYQFRKHLAGDLTLGIWPHLNNRFTVLDLDDEDARSWKDVAARLMDLRLHFSIEYSGRKGYHFWIFWDRILSNEQLRKLQAFLLDGIPADTNCWPHKAGLIKLPLGLHRHTWNLACFLDYTGAPIPLEQQFAYFLSIQQNQVPSEFLHGTSEPVTVGVSIKSSLNTDAGHSQPKKIKKTEKKGSSGIYDQCLALGTKLPDGRHHTLFLLAVYLKNERKVSSQEAFMVLANWSRRVPSKHSVRDRLRDVSSTVTRVYQTPITMNQYERVELSPEEQGIITDCVCSSLNSVIGSVGSEVRKEDASKRLKTAAKVALVLASLLKGTSGTLDIGCRSLAREAGVSKNALRRALEIIVSDEVESPAQNSDEYDPVLWNFDQRPLRRGGPFVCVSRGSFPNFDRSIYRLRDDVQRELRWPVVTSTVGSAPRDLPAARRLHLQVAGRDGAAGGSCPYVRSDAVSPASGSRTSGQPSSHLRHAMI